MDKLSSRQFSKQVNTQAELSNAWDKISEQSFITKALMELKNDSA